MYRYRINGLNSAQSIGRSMATVLLILIVIAACAPAATEQPADQPADQPVIEQPPTEPPAQQSQLPVTTCDTMLPPEACDPEWESRIVYEPLGNLPTSECTERFLDTGLCVNFTYTNNAQVFTIAVEGADTAVVEEYIKSTAVFFEARQAGTQPPPDTGLPSLVTILIDAAQEVTGFNQTDLSILRDQLTEERESSGGFITFNEVLYVAVGDDVIPGRVVSVAVENAARIYAERGYDGSLIPEEMQALANEPGAPFLIDPAALPQDDSAYKDILVNKPFGLVVTLNWENVPKDPESALWVVWYAIDPVLPPAYKGPLAQTSVNAWAYVYYKERCNVTTASSRITATAGSMTNTFFRSSPYFYVGSRTADVRGNASPAALSHSSSPGVGTYDTYVRGGSGGGQYYIYGGWIQGSGCR